MLLRRFVNLFVLGLALPSCGGGDEDPRTQEPPKKQPDIVEEVTIARRDCPSAEGAPAFRRIGLAVDARVGDCGEVVWLGEDEQSLLMVGPNGEPREVSADGYLLWLEGSALLLSEGGEVKLLDGDAERGAWEVEDPRVGGPLPGDDAVWVCTGDGIARLDARGVTPLTPDFLKAEHSPGCWYVAAAPQGVIAYPTNDGKLGFVDATTGERWTSDREFLVYGQEDAEGRERFDEIRFSSDGALLFLEKRWFQVYDHWIEIAGDGTLDVVEVETGKVHRLPGTISDPWIFVHSGLGYVWYGPWMGTAPGVFLPSIDGSGHLLGFGDPIRLDSTWPRMGRGNEVFVESEEYLARIDLERGKVRDLLHVRSIDNVGLFRWGGSVAVAHATGRCIRESEASRVCHTVVWALSTWERQGGGREMAWSAQDALRIHAIGPDGSMIVEGSLFAENPPSVAPFSMPDYRYVLLDPDGNVVRDLDLDAKIVSGLGGEHFAILHRARYEDEVRTEELTVVDWTTGEERPLVSGRFIDGWYLDHSDRRLTAFVLQDDPWLFELWTGVVTP